MLPLSLTLASVPVPEIAPPEYAPANVTIETARGNIEVRRMREQEPKTAANFLGYVDAGFYAVTDSTAL